MAALVALAVVVPALAGAPAAAQSDTVTLTVSVVDRNDDPVSGATIHASWDGGSGQGTTAGNGKTFLDVPSGQKVTLMIEHPDYVRNRPFNVTRSSDGDVTVPVARTATLTIEATTPDGASVEGATVTVSRSGRIAAQGRTGSDGRFSSGDIESGEYEVEVTKAGYFSQELTADPGGPLTRRVTLEAGTVQYEFRVTDDHFDPARALSNATVRVGSVGSVRTLGGGAGSIGVPVNTVQQVEVTKPGYRSVTREVRVDESAENVTLSIQRSTNVSLHATNRRVVAGERVTVEVRNAYGEPVEGAAVLLGDRQVGTTDANGQYAVAIGEGGTHELRARADGVTSDPVSVEGVVPAGSDTTTGAEATTEEESGAMAPGFGTGAALAALALLGAAGVARRRG